MDELYDAFKWIGFTDAEILEIMLADDSVNGEPGCYGGRTDVECDEEDMK